MAAFALGLIGDASARPALLAALKDPQPLLQGRAAEALGLIGDRADAPPIGAMVQAHIKAGALMGVAPDDLTYPLSAPAEAARLGLYALARLGAYDALGRRGPRQRSAGLDLVAGGLCAAARRRPARAPALLALVNTPGRFTASFAVKGLGSSKATQLRRRCGRSSSSGSDRARRDSGGPVAGRDGRRRRRAGADKIVADAAVRSDAASRGDDRAWRRSSCASGVDLLLDLVSNSVPAFAARRCRRWRGSIPIRSSSALAASMPTGTGRCAWRGATRSARCRRRRVAPPDGDAAGPRSARHSGGARARWPSSKAPGAERVLLERLKAGGPRRCGAAANALADLKVAAAVQPLAEAYRRASRETATRARAAALGRWLVSTRRPRSRCCSRR